MVRSREQAAEAIAAGRVLVAGAKATKPATAVTTAVAIVVREDENDPGYVSRGAHKLVGALDAFCPLGFAVAGRVCLDAGASTGGFTDVLLRRDVARIHAVDVGYGQLAWALQQDPRVIVHDRTNIRELDVATLGEPVEVVVADLSFISLKLVLPALLGVVTPEADLALMVKPQFEVGKERVGKGGVVRDPALRAEAVWDVAEAAAAAGWGARAVVRSPLPGPSGNVEFFLWLRSGAAEITESEVLRAATEDPQPAPLGVPDERVDP